MPPSKTPAKQQRATKGGEAFAPRFAYVTPTPQKRPPPQAPATADRTSPIESLRGVAIIQATQARSIFARLLAEERVHPHFRASAMGALAQTADPAWLPHIVKHARGADADSVACVVYAYGAVALDALRGHIDDDIYETVAVEVEDFLLALSPAKRSAKRPRA